MSENNHDSEPLKQNTSAITISDWQQFYKLFVNMRGSFTFNQEVVNWANVAATLNQGCSCTRKSRISSLESGYKSMGIYLTSENKEEIKNFYQAEKIILKSDNLEFLSF